MAMSDCVTVWRFEYVADFLFSPFKPLRAVIITLRVARDIKSQLKKQIKTVRLDVVNYYTRKFIERRTSLI